MLVRFAYLAHAHAFAVLRLFRMTDGEKEVEILALCHQFTVLQRQLGNQRPRLWPEDRAFLAALLVPLARATLRGFRLLVSPDTVDATPADVDRCWQMFLRRFDIEHTFRLFKQTLGWTRPRLRDPESADRWTWLILAVHTQLRLARPLVTDLRRPWERPTEPTKLTPARVRRGFRNIHTKTAHPAAAPKPGRDPDGLPARRIVLQRNASMSDSSWPPASHTPDQPTTRRAPNPAEPLKRQAEA